MAKGIQRKLDKVLKVVNEEIAGIANRGGLYAGGLSSEGYAGGYRDAINDVQIALNGSDPKRRHYWDKVESLSDYDTLECLDCGGLCKPYKISPNGTVHYRCRRESEHGDCTPRHFSIDVNGDYHGG